MAKAGVAFSSARPRARGAPTPITCDREARGRIAASQRYAVALAAFARRSERLRAIGEELRAREAAGRLTEPIASLVHSYIHMHVNRMIRTSQRAHELVLYDLLRRHYEGLVARARQRPA